MSIKQCDYETALAEYSDRERVVTLLGQHRQYLSLIPSMRRANESIITIPLPLAKVRYRQGGGALDDITSIPCDIAVLMCDPEWKIKMGVEILIFIHRPGEDFSDLLLRWRHSQSALAHEYEWIMPEAEDHMFSDVAEKILPLFVVFPQTPSRIIKGLKASSLPYIIFNNLEAIVHEAEQKSLSEQIN
ncbi:MAG: hypothetical protein IGQ45_05210 [Cyanobacterium sp. T60_A2020_053]|nr:hypothetical protein [Cyanobacterium sp. T60_A2020_053]